MSEAVLEIGKEYPPQNEAEYLEKLLEIAQHNLNRQQKPVMRGEHAKPHGCVKAQFKVAENLPEHLRVGIFTEPKTYSAFVRFSNGNSRSQPDNKGDGRGMAIKLLDVPGKKVLSGEEDATTHDFILINHPVFIVRNLQDYVDFFEAAKLAKGKFPVKFFFPGINPWEWHLSELKIAISLLTKKIQSPLTLQYWSMTPYKFGDKAMKLSAKPGKPNKLAKSYPKSDNYLQQVMSEYLAENEAEFDFFVQIQTDAQKMPIEDPTVEWNAPLEKVATITIPRQTFTSPTQIEFTENLSYNPWHSLPEHMPLGGINRARKLIYQQISQIRHDDNHVSKREPTLEDFESF
ncbi:catalase family protein [Merismopedia glauca]|uniref:Catalase n=1 Tax=Merismopedia glauca CCAP 1448/3 TaxID=1296344 RepID=A0A2T1C495_9CYAN|nr:catalase family protein [Merismopedia glauca]PSB02943.1 catalase [Merismopedia glauca CCAP 1448/3]